MMASAKFESKFAEALLVGFVGGVLGMPTKRVEPQIVVPE